MIISEVDRMNYSCKRLQYWVRLFWCTLYAKWTNDIKQTWKGKNCDTNAARREQQASQIIK